MTFSRNMKDSAGSRGWGRIKRLGYTFCNVGDSLSREIRVRVIGRLFRRGSRRYGGGGKVWRGEGG